MASSDERLKALSKRFNKTTEDPTPETKSVAPKKKEVTRRRHSLYLDNGLVEQCDQTYKQMAHDLYPVELSKSDFLEACLKFALQHKDEIKQSLTQE